MTQDVSHYGVHYAPGKIGFLHQGRGATNVIGLRESSPFVVRTRRRWICNHMIQTNALNPARSHLEAFERLVSKNSLVRFMLPLPTGGVGMITREEMDDDLLPIALLCKLSSPIRLPIFFLNMTTPKTITDELEMTNVQPLVLAGISAANTQTVQHLVSVARTTPRKLLLIPDADVPVRNVMHLEAGDMLSQDDVDLAALPWETLGAITIRAEMRGEWDKTWFTREPTPGNEVKSNDRDRSAAGLPSS